MISKAAVTVHTIRTTITTARCCCRLPCNPAVWAGMTERDASAKLRLSDGKLDPNDQRRAGCRTACWISMIKGARRVVRDALGPCPW